MITYFVVPGMRWNAKIMWTIVNYAVSVIALSCGRYDTRAHDLYHKSICQLLQKILRCVLRHLDLCSHINYCPIVICISQVSRSNSHVQDSTCGITPAQQDTIMNCTCSMTVRKSSICWVSEQNIWLNYLQWVAARKKRQNANQPPTVWC